MEPSCIPSWSREPLLILIARCGLNREDTRPVFLAANCSVIKTRFSELAGEAACNQEYTGGLQQGLDNEAEAIVAQRQASVLKHPGIAALDRPAVLSQP